MMQAAVYTQYGPPEVVSVREIERPVPRANEVLINVHATTVSSGDWRMRSLEIPAGFGPMGRLVAGVFGPRKQVLGTDLSGEIVAMGARVTGWSLGDAVVAYPSGGMGAHAQFIAMKADGIIVHKPARLSHIEAAAIPFGGLTALEFLRDKGGLQAGEKLLIVGASGATGSTAVQLAKHFGADVTAVCSAANAQLVESLGADRVIDYASVDFAAGAERYDMVLDTTGTAPWARVKPILTPKGRLVIISGSLGDMLRAPFVSRKSGKRIVSGVSNGTRDGLKFLVDLVEQGKFSPLIDRTYSLNEIQRAHAHVDTGRKKGAVVVTMTSAG